MSIDRDGKNEFDSRRVSRYRSARGRRSEVDPALSIIINEKGFIMTKSLGPEHQGPESWVELGRELVAIERRMTAHERKAEAVDRHLESVSALMSTISDDLRRFNPADPATADEVYQPFQAIIDAAREVVKSRDDAGSWDKLKNSIAVLSYAINAYDALSGGRR